MANNLNKRNFRITKTSNNKILLVGFPKDSKSDEAIAYDIEELLTSLSEGSIDLQAVLDNGKDAEIDGSINLITTSTGQNTELASGSTTYTENDDSIVIAASSGASQIYSSVTGSGKDYKSLAISISQTGLNDPEIVKTFQDNFAETSDNPIVYTLYYISPGEYELGTNIPTFNSVNGFWCPPCTTATGDTLITTRYSDSILILSLLSGTDSGIDNLHLEIREYLFPN